MGLSASQARLLDITARLSNNELHSQFITNSKLRLADRSHEASTEYMKALNSTELLYSNYNNNGNKVSEKLTANSVIAYGELKNQYGLINNSGQLLVNGTDIKNYQTSGKLSEFLAKYDIPLKTNPKYEESLNSLFGSNYEYWFDENDVYGSYNRVMNAYASSGISQLVTTNTSGNINVTSMDPDTYNAWKENYLNNMSALLPPDDTELKELYGNWIKTLLNPPEATAKPTEPTPPTSPPPPTMPAPPSPPEEVDYTQKIYDIMGSCMYPYVIPNGQNCFMHVLSDLIGEGTHTTSSGETLTINHESAWNWNSANIGHDGHRHEFEDLNQAAAAYTASDGSGRSVLQVIIDFLWDHHTEYNGSATGGAALPETLAGFFNIVDGDLTDAYVAMFGSIGNNTEYEEAYAKYLEQVAEWEAECARLQQDYNKELEKYNYQYEQYQKDHEVWEKIVEKNAKNLQEAVSSWYLNCDELKVNFLDWLENLPDKQIANEQDPKCKWYTNLWYRMGGLGSNDTNNNMYAKLDDNLAKSPEWLQYALESGIITMEQVIFQKEGSVNYDLDSRDWQSSIYTSVVDISEQPDELAITRAQVKYESALREIQMQDKKYDQDLKKLDTEHNALQTEFESIKGIVQKNIERSFKAFS